MMNKCHIKYTNGRWGHEYMYIPKQYRLNLKKSIIKIYSYWGQIYENDETHRLQTRNDVESCNISREKNSTYIVTYNIGEDLFPQQ